MKVHELVALLRRFPPEVPVRLSAKGLQLPHPHVGVGMGPDLDLCAIVADRDAFAGRLPDLLLMAPQQASTHTSNSGQAGHTAPSHPPVQPPEIPRWASAKSKRTGSPGS